MPDFQGTQTIMLRPGANRVPISFEFRAASANNTNDGSIPYGATITGAAVAVYDQEGIDRTTATVNSNTTQLVGLVVSTALKHPNTGADPSAAIEMRGINTYTAVVTVTLSTNATIPFECRRILVDARPG